MIEKELVVKDEVGLHARPEHDRNLKFRDSQR